MKLFDEDARFLLKLKHEAKFIWLNIDRYWFLCFIYGYKFYCGFFFGSYFQLSNFIILQNRMPLVINVSFLKKRINHNLEDKTVDMNYMVAEFSIKKVETLFWKKKIEIIS